MPETAAWRLARAHRRGPRKPLHRCLRSKIPSQSYVREDFPMLDRVHRALREIDRNFEIVYDKALAPQGGPGHVLYRCLRKGATPAYDLLQMESPLQHDMRLPWPSGKPREVGLWIVGWVKERDRATRGGSKKRIVQEDADRATVAAHEDQVKEDQALDEFAKDAGRDLAVTAIRNRKGRVVNGLKKKKP